MVKMENNDVQQGAARAMGRTWGALFFSVFGGGWLLLSMFAYGVMKPPSVAAIAIGVVLLVAVAIKTQKRAKKVPPEPEDEARKRDRRSFGIINAVQWAAV